MIRRVIPVSEITRVSKRAARPLTIYLVLACLISFLVCEPAYAAGAGQVILTARQVFTMDGLSAPPSATFAYRLTPQTTVASMPAGSGPEGYTFAITGTGEAQIGPIHFSKSGIYVYDLRCVTIRSNGYTIDPQTYTIQIYAEDGQAPVAIIHKNDGDKAAGITFSQNYRTSGSPDDPGVTIDMTGPPAGAPLPSDPDLMVDFSVEKSVSGRPLRDDAFTFLMIAENPANPMPYGSENNLKTIRITGSGQSRFGTWSYTEEGIYRYQVSEGNAGMDGYTYDITVYTITDDVEAVDGQLTVTRAVTNDRGQRVEAMRFVNSYAPPGTPNAHGDNPKTGDSGNPVFWAALIAVCGALLVFITAIDMQSEKKYANKSK